MVVGYRWGIFFSDGAYYLRSVSEPTLFHPSWKLADRWVHLNFLWLLVRALGGPSALAFHGVLWCYRLLMFSALYAWWRVFKRCWAGPADDFWGALFILTSPLAIYSPSQVLPEQWSLLLTGLGTLAFLAGAEKSDTRLSLASGALLYLGFLSRSDAILLPAAFLLSCFVFQYRPRKELRAPGIWALATFLPLFLAHVRLVGAGNLAPMALHMWNSEGGVFSKGLKEFGRAAGLFLPLAAAAVALNKAKGTRILALTCAAVYAFFLAWIATGHVAYGRHTLQGVVALSGLAAIGFRALGPRALGIFALGLAPYIAFVYPRNAYPSWQVLAGGAAFCAMMAGVADGAKSRGIILFCLGQTFLHIGLANRAAGGVEINQAKRVFEYAAKDDGNLLLVGEAPTFAFYKFYYPRARRARVYSCLNHELQAQERRSGYFQRLLESLGDRHVASMAQLESLSPQKIIYIGDPALSWLIREKGVLFKPLRKLERDRGRPVSEVVLPTFRRSPEGPAPVRSGVGP